MHIFWKWINFKYTPLSGSYKSLNKCKRGDLLWKGYYFYWFQRPFTTRFLVIIPIHITCYICVISQALFSYIPSYRSKNGYNSCSLDAGSSSTVIRLLFDWNMTCSLDKLDVHVVMVLEPRFDEGNTSLDSPAIVVFSVMTPSS